jgi:hypothetical protein
VLKYSFYNDLYDIGQAKARSSLSFGTDLAIVKDLLVMLTMHELDFIAVHGADIL